MGGPSLKMSNRFYDVLKYIAVVFLPALGTLYFGLSQFWDIFEPEKVVGTIMVVDTFLGVLLKLSTDQYNESEEKFDGHITVHDPKGDEGSTLNVSIDPSSVGNKSEVTLKVEKAS